MSRSYPTFSRALDMAARHRGFGDWQGFLRSLDYAWTSDNDYLIPSRRAARALRVSFTLSSDGWSWAPDD